MSWKIVLGVIFLIFLSIFAMQNYEVVTVKFLAWSFETSLAIMTFSTGFAGILIGFIAAVAGRKKPEKEDEKNADL